MILRPIPPDKFLRKEVQIFTGTMVELSWVIRKCDELQVAYEDVEIETDSNAGVKIVVPQLISNPKYEKELKKYEKELQKYNQKLKERDEVFMGTGI